MAKGFKNGVGGGNPLNFKVVGNPQPASAKKNTIWIDTDQKITGWEFSATDPSLNLVKSSFVNPNKNVYAGVLYVDFDLQPNTTYTMGFNGQDGNNYYINENLFENYTVVKVGAERTVVHFTTKDTDVSGSYADGMGWLILKNDKNQTNDHVFDNIYIVEGDSEIDLEGMVWFVTDRASSASFNALKKNGIQVYPISAKQYIGGAWVDKTAKTWLDGAWVDWVPQGALYWDGIQAVDWIAKNSVGQSSWTAIAPTFGDSTVTISPGEYANKFCGIVTNDKVDITGYTKLVIEFESVANVDNTRSLHVHISTKQTEWISGSSTVATKAIESNPGNVVELPFTASGSYYIDIFCIRTAVAKIKRVYLKK